MNSNDIAHRFCNKDFGKDGHLKAGNVSVNGRNYFSYNSVFAQWVDFDKNVCLVYEGSSSPSSNRHKIYGSYFPSGTHVLPYDDKYFGGYGYHGCELLYWDYEFDWDDRKKLLDYWIDSQLSSFEAIKDGKTKGLEKVPFKFWGHVEKLCSLYKDTSVNKWLKGPSRIPEKRIKQAKKMVKLLMKGERNVQVITDAIFGKGTFQRYMDYCGRFQRANKKKEQMEWLCNRLGIESPYEGHSRHRWWGEPKMTAAQIRKLTAKERNEMHFKSLALEAWEEYRPIREDKYEQNKRNAYKYIIGFDPVYVSQWSKEYKSVDKVRNRYTGEVYNTTESFDLPGFLDWKIEFDYDSFRTSGDKEQWIQDFYDKCKRHNDNLLALNKMKEINAHQREKKHYYETDRYIDDEYLRQNTTDEEYALCVAYINAVDKYCDAKEARERAAAIRYQREEEERRLEKELQEKVKREQIESYIKQGPEGCRNLWRMHLTSINDAKLEFDEACLPDEGDFYNGGNVLMRFGMRKDLVETSMSIKLDIPTCKKFWRLINIWHNDPSKFRETKIDTHYSGTYTIVSYEDDILTAGCHEIAYTEMERMYNAIIENEKAA